MLNALNDLGKERRFTNLVHLHLCFVYIDFWFATSFPTRGDPGKSGDEGHVADINGDCAWAHDVNSREICKEK